MRIAIYTYICIHVQANIGLPEYRHFMHVDLLAYHTYVHVVRVSDNAIIIMWIERMKNARTYTNAHMLQ